MSRDIKKITQHSSMMFMGKIFDSFIMFAFNALAAMILGGQHYGTYVYISAFVMFVSIAIKFGMDQGITALVPKQENEETKKSLISFSIYSLIAMGLVTIILAVVGSEFISKYVMNKNDYGLYIVINAPLFLFYAMMNLSEGILRTIGEIKHFVIAKNILMPVAIVGGFLIQVFVLGKRGVEVLFISNYMGWIAAVTYFIVILLKKHLLVKLDSNHKHLYKQLLVVSSGLILVGFLDYLIGRIDSFVIGYMLDESDVGVYNIFDKIAYLSTYFFVAFSSIMAPYISEAYHEGAHNALKSLYHFVTKIIVVVNAMIISVLILNLEWILRLFEEAYVDNKAVVIMLLSAYFINCIGGPVIYMNTMTGNGKRELHIGLLSLLANIVLDVILIGPYGIQGVALSTVGVFLIALVIRLVILYRTQQILPFSIRYVLGLLMAVVALVISIWVKAILPIDSEFFTGIISACLFVILWLVPIGIFGVTKEEKGYIKEIVQGKRQKMRGNRD